MVQERIMDRGDFTDSESDMADSPSSGGEDLKDSDESLFEKNRGRDKKCAGESESAGSDTEREGLSWGVSPQFSNQRTDNCANIDKNNSQFAELIESSEGSSTPKGGKVPRSVPLPPGLLGHRKRNSVKDCDETLSDVPITKSIIPKFSVESLCEGKVAFKDSTKANAEVIPPLPYFHDANSEKRIEEKTASKKLAFGIDRILSETRELPDRSYRDERRDDRHMESLRFEGVSPSSVVGTKGLLYENQYLQQHNHLDHHRTPRCSGGPGHYSSTCSECYLLARYCRRISYATPPNTTNSNSVSASFTWIPPSSSSSQSYQSGDNHNPSFISSNAFQAQHLSSFNLSPSNFANMSSLVSCNTGGSGRRKRSWSRAVFSNLQRKGLEKRFQLQKYITKPDRRQLAATLGLTDAQVKVWFQNRRMKWRHSKEGKQGSGSGLIDDAIQINKK